MTIFSTGRVSLLVVVLASVGLSTAARVPLSVTEDDVKFTVVAFDDGRNTPYRLKFTQDYIESSYTFNKDSQVTTINVGAERYKVRDCRICRRKRRMFSLCSEPLAMGRCIVRAFFAVG